MTPDSKKQPKTKEQLAEEFGVSRRTLYNWLKKHKIEVGRGLILPIKLTEIYSKLGDPR